MKSAAVSAAALVTCVYVVAVNGGVIGSNLTSDRHFTDVERQPVAGRPSGLLMARDLLALGRLKMLGSVVMTLTDPPPQIAVVPTTAPAPEAPLAESTDTSSTVYECPTPNTNEGCPAGQYCTGAHVCADQLIQEDGCTADAQCLPPYQCERFLCRRPAPKAPLAGSTDTGSTVYECPTPNTIEGCPTGQYCTGAHVCADQLIQQDGCTADAQCLPPYQCKRFLCSPAPEAPLAGSTDTGSTVYECPNARMRMRMRLRMPNAQHK